MRAMIPVDLPGEATEIRVFGHQDVHYASGQGWKLGFYIVLNSSNPWSPVWELI